jgi:hypothetical protein
MRGYNFVGCNMQSDSIFLDEIRRVHEQYDSMSKRLTRLEDKGKGEDSDPMIKFMKYVAMAYIVSLLLPIVIDLFRGK